MDNKIIDTVKAAGGFVKYAEQQAKEVSDTLREKVEQTDLSAEKEFVKQKARHIVHKVSKKSYSVFESHKDVLPEKLKPVSETLALILESVVELSKNDDEEDHEVKVEATSTKKRRTPKKEAAPQKAKKPRASKKRSKAKATVSAKKEDQVQEDSSQNS